jgi:Predicted integral membrane protein (DUF2269)
MSFTDRLVLWLHVGFAIFTIGPVTVAIMSTPRYVRTRNLIVVRYLYRITRVFALVSLGVLVMGLILAQLKKDFSRPWLTASMTLFVVAVVLLLLIIRDQRRAIAALQLAAAAESVPASGLPAETPGSPEGTDPEWADDHSRDVQPGSPAPEAAATAIATVERGRITTMGGVVSLIWLVILVLMVWNS